MEKKPYDGIGETVVKRLPWLSMLLVLGLTISTVIGGFERIVRGSTEVVFFQSLILGMAGNTATQSLAETVRLLSTRTLTKREKIGLFRKEMKVGSIQGGSLGAAALLLSAAYLFWFKKTAGVFALSVGSAVGLSLWCAMILSGSLGSLIPIGLQHFGLDPAVAGGPLITTLVDLFSVVIYYSLAAVLLQTV